MLEAMTRWRRRVGALVGGFEAGQSGRRLRHFTPSRAHLNTLVAAAGADITARARWLVRNNGYAANAIESWAGNVVGAGIKPSSMIPDAGLKAEVQRLWLDWTDEADAEAFTDFYGLQRRVAREVFLAGEVFLRFRPRRPEDGLAVPLQLQMIPSEMLPLTRTEPWGGNPVRQGVRGFGVADAADPLATVMERKLTRMRVKHAQTREYMEVNALRGIVKDGAGTTLYDYFSEFGLAQLAVDFVLGTAGTQVQAKVREVLRHVETELKGETMSGVLALVSPEFFDKLIGHAKVEEAYKYFSSTGAQPLREDTRRRFPFAGIVFEEYNATVTLSTGATETLIPAGEGIAFPLGTLDTFVTHGAPANLIETVNTVGLPIYARQISRPDGSAIEVKTEASILPVNKRPRLAVRIHSSN